MNENTPTKPVFASKTVIVNAIIAIAALYPPVGGWVSAHPEATLNGIVALNIALRFITKGKVTLF